MYAAGEWLTFMGNDITINLWSPTLIKLSEVKNNTSQKVFAPPHFHSSHFGHSSFALSPQGSPPNTFLSISQFTNCLNFLASHPLTYHFCIFASFLLSPCFTNRCVLFSSCSPFFYLFRGFGFSHIFNLHFFSISSFFSALRQTYLS